MGMQRVEHNWVTEHRKYLQSIYIVLLCLFIQGTWESADSLGQGVGSGAGGTESQDPSSKSGGKLGVLQSMGSQGVRHDWVTEQQDTQVCSIVSNSFDPMDCSPPGSSVCGISQARILEWVAIFSSSGSSWLRDWTQVSWVSCIGRWILYHLSHLGIPALNLLQCVVFVEGQVENLASYQLTSWKKTILIFQIKVSIFLWYSTKALSMVISQIFVAKWNLKVSMNFHINCFIAGLSCTLNSSFIQAWFCDIK